MSVSLSHPAVVAGVPARGLNFFLAGRRAQGRTGFVPAARVTHFRDPCRSATLTLLPRACRRRGDCPSERFLLPRLGGLTDGRVTPPRTLPSFQRSLRAAEAGEGGCHLLGEGNVHSGTLSCCSVRSAARASAQPTAADSHPSSHGRIAAVIGNSVGVLPCAP